MAMNIRTTKVKESEYSGIAKRLRELRLDKRLTQVEMAHIVGLAAPSISSLEQGLYTPNFAVLRNVKKHFGVSYSWIIDGEEDESNKDGEKIAALEDEVKMLRNVVKTLTKQ